MALCIVGCGNLDRGDDAAGVLVVRRLRTLGVETDVVKLIEQNGESFRLMDCWSGFESVIVVDATAPAGTPGKIRVWNASVDRLPEEFFACSTHAFGVREAVELGRALKCLPASLTIYGIEGKAFPLGAPLSPQVEHAVESAAQQVLEALPAISAQGTSGQTGKRVAR